MHKLIRKTILMFAAITILFGAALPTYGQSLESTVEKIKSQLTTPAILLAPPIGPIMEAINIANGGTSTVKKIAEIANGGGASLIGWVSVKAISYLLFVLSYIAGFIGSTVFTLAGLFVEFGLYLNTTILDGEVVQLGWRFCRDLANLGFTIGIVVIAYATMLGIESYGIKKMIQNFVIAAVMVNFSFSLAGFAIDISNMLTHFFVNAAIGGGAGEVDLQSIHRFTETLASTFSPQKLLVTNTGNLGVYQSLSSDDGLIAAVLSMFFVALFTAFAALGMLMVGLTTISRFVHLSALIIIMPMAILCYAFPNTKKHFGKWYEQFMCQLTYLPTAMFAMYIVIMFVQVKSNIGFGGSQAIDLENLLNSFEAAKGAPGGLTSTRTLELMATPFKTITNMILVLTMLFYGITKSRTIGCAGGDIALKWTTGLKDWATGKSQGGGAYGWVGRKYLSGGGTKEDNRGTRLAGFLQRIPIISRFAPQVNKFTAGTSKNLSNLATEAAGMGDVQLRNAIYNPDIKIDSERMAAFAKEAVSRGLLNNPDSKKGISQEKLDEFIPALKRYGFDTDILKKAPHLYSKFGLNIKKDGDEYVNKEDGKKFDDAIKAFKPEDGEDLPVEALKDVEVVRRLSGAQLEKLPKDKEHRDAFSNTIIRLREKIGSTEFDKYMGKTFAKKETAAALTPQLLSNKDVVRNLTNDHLKYFSDAGKEKQRSAFLATINEKDTTTGEYKLSEKEFADFMKKNFDKAKDINEINPDILRNGRVFGKLQGMHISQLQKEPDTAQHVAVLETLRDEYRNAFADQKTLTHLDSLAKVIIDNKDNSTWSAIDTVEGKTPFNEIEMDYRRRHPNEEKQQKGVEVKTEVKEEKKREGGWWEDDDKNPPMGGSGGGLVTPKPTPLKPSDGSTYRLAGSDPANTTKTDPIQPKKSVDIGNAIDSLLKKDSTRQPEEPKIKTPQAADLTNDYLESLETATNPQPAIKPTGTPITPPELDILAEQESKRIKSTDKGWQPPEPIDAEWEPKNKIEYKDPLNQPKRIEYKGPLTPPPTPTPPEPIRTTLREEKDRNDNQLIRPPTDQSHGDNSQNLS